MQRTSQLDRTDKILMAICAVGILLYFGMVTHKQVGYWGNDITLWEHAVEVTENNWLAHNNLGVALAQAGRTYEAEQHFKEALRIYPGYQDARHNLELVRENNQH